MEIREIKFIGKGKLDACITRIDHMTEKEILDLIEIQESMGRDRFEFIEERRGEN